LLSCVDWYQLLTVNKTANDLWSAFATVLQQDVDLFVPRQRHTIAIKKSCKKSYPRKIRGALARKQRLLGQHKAELNDLVLHNLYKQAEAHCHDLIKKHQIKRENDVIKSNNLGKFYRFVNRCLSNKKSIGAIQRDDGTVVTSDRERAELLNKYFSSVCVHDDGKNPPSKRDTLRNGNLMDTAVFSADKVIHAMRKLKPNLSNGPDGFPPLLFVQLSNCLAEPLSLIFTSFIYVTKIPDEWRRAVVTPVYKSGRAGDVSNYRPIS
jgi:hypothetical protein